MIGLDAVWFVTRLASVYYIQFVRYFYTKKTHFKYAHTNKMYVCVL